MLPTSMNLVLFYICLISNIKILSSWSNIKLMEFNKIISLQYTMKYSSLPLDFLKFRYQVNYSSPNSLVSWSRFAIYLG